MTTRAIAGAAGLLLATAPGAWALTAQEVWQGWQDHYDAMDARLAAEERTENGRLTLTDPVIEMQVGAAGAVSRYEGDIVLSDQDDGSVRVELPETLRIVVETTLPETEDAPAAAPGPMTLAVTHDGLDIVVRDAEVDPDGQVWTMAAATLTTTIEDVTQGRASEPQPMQMVLSGFESSYRSMPEADGLRAEQSGSAESFTISFDVDDMSELDPEAAPAGTDRTAGAAGFTLDYRATGIEYEGGGVLAPGALMDLGKSSDFDVRLSHSGAELSMNGTSPQGDFSIEGASQGAEATVGIIDGALSEAVASDAMDLTVQVPQFPAPLSLSAARVGVGFDAPVVATDADTAAPFGLMLELRDLAVDDMLWGLFDPTGQLPRDPASILVTLDGTAKLFVDLLTGDPEAIAALDGPPGEIETLSVTELLIEAVGARLIGSGDLTFPTPDPSRPVGALDVTLSGGFALLDRLVALGFLPAQQAGFVKGMAGAVAQSSGEDELTSRIEFTKDGGITAGGMPLR